MAQEVVEAPMPGKILKVSVTVGNTVEEYGEICTLEAMKMENPVFAPVKGHVTELAVSAGQTVKTGEKIAVIEY
jgi:biotin carboxyl carrier protein